MTGPVLLITGGSRGIGRAVALKAAREGWQVAVNYLRESEAAARVVSDIRSAGGNAKAYAADMGEPSAILALFHEVVRDFGRLDGFVNNAGIVDQTARLDEMSDERLERMFRINTLGAVIAAREAVRRLSTRHGGQGGTIVNMSSMAAVLGSPGQYVDYAASKAAIDTLTVGLAREVATEGVRVNAIRPGVIDTDIHASGGLPDRARDMVPLIPMQRAGTAEEIADAVLFLLSPQASYITGAILNVSGGR
ncbi:SDR family oxidoreductase [Gellertiella hungarica]|uniref:NAD(P)-dependent dehydrogenase (Short-subunit alcohol dehydrogenase family) n=1 Tax=Gellertiella hungarica TaxID=1572859 RepID=A0A7W6J5K8_9HYPH|nr:SDR family oxidoreductase [Gellertiella hungarica]MBB4065216.1 NAD(P)-dependent dehydrogenase (short-subunit alcohol dehydrogenase family) [Gellertiella hungarica]